jgi:hypothetical protein
MSELLLPSSYLGQVATRCFMPRGILTGAGRWMMTRSVHWMRDRAVNPVIGLANWRVASGVESSPGIGLVRVSIEYPAGSFTEAQENIAAGSQAIEWPEGTSFFHFDVTIPNGAKFWVRVLQKNDNGVLFRQPQHDSIEPAADCAMEYGSGDPADKTMGGTITPSAWAYHPVLILAQTRRPSVLVFGDSREEGGTEGPRPPHYLNGMCIGALGRLFGFSSVAESATQLTTFVNGTAANRTHRLALAPYVSHVLDAYGVNDLSQNRTVAQLLADRASFAAMFPDNTVIGTTIMPYVPSTDGWRSKANQGLGTNQPKIREANRSIRAGIAGEAFILDTARSVDPFDEDKYVVAADASAATGAPACEFTGSITGTTLTVSAIASGSLTYGATLTDSLSGTSSNLPFPGTMVLEQLTGTAGASGTYRVNFPQTVAAKTMYVGGWATSDGLHNSHHMVVQATERLASQIGQIIR